MGMDGGLLGPIGGILGGVGGLLGGGGGAVPSQQPAMPTPIASYPGSMPPAWPGFPVPQANPSAAPPMNWTGDLSQPGAGENFFAQNAGKWQQPTKLGGWYDANQGKFNTPGPADQYWKGLSGRMNAPKTSQNAQTAWDQFNSMVPPNTDPYYDNAVRTATRDINSQMAAAGLYGGGTGLAPVNEAITNIRAQQAKDEAEYGLQRAGLGGNLAAGADASSLGNLQGQLGWLSGLGNLSLGVQNADLARWLAGANVAGNADTGELNKLMSGMQSALGAQDALRTRGQDFFGNNLMMGQALANPLQNIYLQSIAADLGLSDQQMQAALGYPREAATQSVNNQQRSESGVMNAFSTFGKMFGM